MQRVKDLYLVSNVLLYAKRSTSPDQGGLLEVSLLVNWSAYCPVSYSFIKREQTEHRLMMIEV